MSKFYGTLCNGRSNVTKCGYEDIKACAQSYDGSIIAKLYYDRGELKARIELSDDSSTYGDTVFIGAFKELKERLDLKIQNKKTLKKLLDYNTLSLEDNIIDKIVDASVEQGWDVIDWMEFVDTLSTTPKSGYPRMLFDYDMISKDEYEKLMESE